jgi:hypothetical protein
MVSIVSAQARPGIPSRPGATSRDAIFLVASRSSSSVTRVGLYTTYPKFLHLLHAALLLLLDSPSLICISLSLSYRDFITLVQNAVNFSHKQSSAAILATMSLSILHSTPTWDSSAVLFTTHLEHLKNTCSASSRSSPQSQQLVWLSLPILYR